ncbi:transposase-like zinc ribbon protein [Chitinophaga niastensis]|uniref:Transposase-like zinc ribbon protein n=1 Tax=Chitinophaga niastensis TaxID=536980 RepID=A0A2P8HVZ2_CHINA|nr:IS1595 family transposase [Chitinophaga niastensis]PSL50376.1 transposase-like zinc ribbon protein [Chitinophaga niastensis]
MSNLIRISDDFNSPEACMNYLAKMRWNGKIKCAFCEHDKVYELKGKYKRYKCSNCRKQFSVTKGTIFENSPIPLQKWFTAIHILSAHKKGISSIQLGKDLKVTQKTAWFMTQRIRYTLKTRSFNKMDGVIQCDESFIGGKNKNRHGDKKVPNTQGRSLKTKTPVFGIMHSTGVIYTQVIPDTKAKTIKPIIKNLIESGSIIVTDEWKAYRNMPADYMHIVLRHTEEEYARGAFHNNTIEGFWSQLKRGIYGIYHHVSPKHLHRYCDEFSYRYNTRKMKDAERFEDTMEKISCRLTYKMLTQY